MAKEYNWHRVADADDELAAEAVITVQDVAGKKVCVTRYQGELYAFAHKCPHAGAFMQEGYIDAVGNIVCPLHRYKFSVKNGRNTSGEGFYLKTYPIELRPEGVFIGFEKGWFSW
ncbi:Rieske 2Fe-2S domain-containing protein [uncultured Chitinophaga sp.]|uniref:Rieske (2Fe-2S) protein n=1 Tax=uncultured Chitinophaga sp. TaxID=339340 RepID=UPI0025ED8D9D|nr:Rieske 2Fe-2S domain-containing protein [uncultured Chitinophaga sp.]